MNIAVADVWGMAYNYLMRTFPQRTPVLHGVSPDEYLAFEEASEIKHEYYHGDVYELTGASENHCLVLMAIVTAIGTQLHDSPCRPYLSSFRLKDEATGFYMYPDFSVICDKTQFADRRDDTFVNPIVLGEIVSGNTELYDYGRKAEFYRSIPTLREYLLVAQDRPHVERYQRQDAGWLFTEYSSLDDVVTLDSIGCMLPLAVIYKRVRFEEA